MKLDRIISFVVRANKPDELTLGEKMVIYIGESRLEYRLVHYWDLRESPCGGWVAGTRWIFDGADSEAETGLQNH